MQIVEPQVVVEALLVAVVCALITAAWLFFARARTLLDIPNNRSSHRVPTVTSGGVGFVIALVTYAVWLFLEGLLAAQTLWLLSGGAALALLGFLDDCLDLSFKRRLLVQVAVIMGLWTFLDSLPPLPLWGGHVLSGWALSLLMGIALLWLVNAFNFMDGIDGLAASESVFCLLLLGLLTVALGQRGFLLLAAVLAVAVFLLFNRPPARLFMGDVGSYFLGYLVGILGLLLVRDEQLGYWSLFITLSTFTADSTATLLGRIRAGGLWYHPHRTHLYQLLASRWGSHGRVCLLYLTVNLLWLAPLAILAESYPAWASLLGLLAWIPLAMAVGLLRNRLMTAEDHSPRAVSVSK
ncbi:MAG: glycosyl transferase [Pseudohongiellaceae bacterium]|jgi:Fuc2NAc and GlcNAc transferase